MHLRTTFFKAGVPGLYFEAPLTPRGCHVYMGAEHRKCGFKTCYLLRRTQTGCLPRPNMMFPWRSWSSNGRYDIHMGEPVLSPLETFCTNMYHSCFPSVNTLPRFPLSLFSSAEFRGSTRASISGGVSSQEPGNSRFCKGACKPRGVLSQRFGDELIAACQEWARSAVRVSLLNDAVLARRCLYKVSFHVRQGV